jgi:hypothetical protein
MKAFLPVALGVLLSATLAHADPETEFTLRISPGCKPPTAKNPAQVLTPVEVDRPGKKSECVEFDPHFGLQGFAYFNADGKKLSTPHHEPPAQYSATRFDARFYTPWGHTGVSVYRRRMGTRDEISSVTFSFGLHGTNGNYSEGHGKLTPDPDAGMIYIRKAEEGTWAWDKPKTLSVIIARVSRDEFRIYETEPYEAGHDLDHVLDDFPASYPSDHVYHEVGSMTYESDGQKAEYHVNRLVGARLEHSVLVYSTHLLQELDGQLKTADLSKIQQL